MQRIKTDKNLTRISRIGTNELVKISVTRVKKSVKISKISVIRVPLT